MTCTLSGRFGPASDPTIKDFDFDRAIRIAHAARGEAPFGYRSEFVQLMRLAQAAAAMTSLDHSSAPQ